MTKKLTHPIIVIGAGASGLTAIKACLEEHLQVTCFEKTDCIGGLWQYREEVFEGVATVMKSTIINTSKEMTCFSDFPPPENFPNFMHNTYMAKYLQMYAEHFGLVQHVRLKHEVLSVKRQEQHDQWLVTVRCQESGATSAHPASAVMVCTGHHSHPYWPHYDGLDEYRGTVLHSHSYRHFEGFSDKNVLVVGIGNSGGDLAVELSHVAAKVYLSTRRGAWVMPRIGDYGQPIDIQYGRRYVLHMLRILPNFLKNAHAAYKLNARYDHSFLNLKPEHNFYSQHPTVNDELPNRLLSGTVILKRDVHHFVQEGVIFEGEPDTVYDIDAVILATGYDTIFPFLDKDVADVADNRLPLYRHVFHPHLPSLVFIGLVQPFGPLPPICELQCRWVVQVLLGRCVLPSVEAMARHVVETHRNHDQRYVRSRRHTVEVDGITYMDEIAAQFGAKPSLARFFFSDWAMFFTCLFGPCVPYHFRLEGPHRWPGARDAIFGVRKRVLAPLNTRLAKDLKREVGADPCLTLRGLLASFVLLTLLCLAFI